MSSEKVRLGVIGAGAIGVDHIFNLQRHPRAEVVALAETSIERGAEAAEKYAIAEVVDDYRKLLDRTDIDAISVALPNSMHASVGLEILDAGKHLFMEKPFATNAADAQKLIDAAEAKNRMLFVGMNQRFRPEALSLQQLVARGDLGDVYYAQAYWLRRNGIPRIGSWFTQKKVAGGGCTYDIGVHMLDLAMFLLNDFDVESVSGQIDSRFGNRGLGEGGWGKSEIDPSRPFDVEDFSAAFLKFRSGRTIQFTASWALIHESRDKHGVQLFGTEAGAVLGSEPRLIKRGADDFIIEDLPMLEPQVEPNRMMHFVDCLLGRAKPLVTPAQALAVQRVLDAIYESSAQRREIRL
jgi:predicted dehydrogenase